MNKMWFAVIAGFLIHSVQAQVLYDPSTAPSQTAGGYWPTTNWKKSSDSVKTLPWAIPTTTDSGYKSPQPKVFRINNGTINIFPDDRVVIQVAPGEICDNYFKSSENTGTPLLSKFKYVIPTGRWEIEFPNSTSSFWNEIVNPTQSFQVGVETTTGCFSNIFITDQDYFTSALNFLGKYKDDVIGEKLYNLFVEAAPYVFEHQD